MAATAPPGWFIRPVEGGHELVRPAWKGQPVTDARPHVVVGEEDLGAAVVDRDGTVRVRVQRLPRDLSRLDVRHGALRESSVRDVRRTAPAPMRSAPRQSSPLGTVVSATYSTGSIRLPGMDHPQEVTGRVVAPRAGRDLPVVVFLHGRHQWCEEGAGEWPCAEGSSPVPNLEGYRHLQEELASRGYFTVSIDANAINAQDQVLPDLGMDGRARLVREHLTKLASWQGGATAPFASTVKARYDLGLTMLVGHNRGGEKVAHAANQSLAIATCTSPARCWWPRRTSSRRPRR
ncbi:hypothetical protein [Luteococcus sp.]|uniref:hypothetical protein n=1 Tax=Luteococcus sp. TaxID=1969402 RepID=UPI003735B31B